MTLASDILALDKCNHRMEEYSIGDVKVFIKTINLADKDILELTAIENYKAGRKRYRSLLIAQCVVDADGKPVFTIEEAESLSPTIGEPLFDRIGKLNAVSKQDEEAIEKNSQSETSGD